jgi:NAD(P)-dependent dehydrogenase (short-subunit alcohol dehydrogenase family)
VAELSDKVFIVTGASLGMGEAIARRIAGAGAGGLILSGRDQARGDAVAAEISATGCKALFMAGDLTDAAYCRSLPAACEAAFGRVDGLVNAAGATDRGGILDVDLETWDKLFSVNVRAPFLLIQESAKLMKRHGNGGAMVNIITMSSHGGQPFLTAYAASKGALVTLTKNAAHALRFDRIRVNALNIGWSDTPHEHVVQTEAMGVAEDWLAEAERRQPFGRLIKPADVAEFTLFLLSPRSGVMTGSVIDHDQNVMGAYD